MCVFSYLSLSEPLEAARMLLRRSDLTALRAATYVALTSGDLEVTSTYATKFVTQCMLSWDWELAADVISQHECFMVRGGGRFVSVGGLCGERKFLVPHISYKMCLTIWGLLTITHPSHFLMTFCFQYLKNGH